MQGAHSQNLNETNSGNRNYLRWLVPGGLTVGASILIGIIGGGIPTPTAPTSETPQQPPAQQQPVPTEGTALESIVVNPNIIHILGAGGDSVKATIDIVNGVPVLIPLDTVRYNPPWQNYNQ